MIMILNPLRKEKRQQINSVEMQRLRDIFWSLTAELSTLALSLTTIFVTASKLIKFSVP